MDPVVSENNFGKGPDLSGKVQYPGTLVWQVIISNALESPECLLDHVDDIAMQQKANPFCKHAENDKSHVGQTSLSIESGFEANQSARYL